MASALRFVSVAAVTTPDPRVSPIDPDRQIVVIVAVDSRGRLLICYPDGDCHRLTPMVVSKPAVKPGLKPRPKPARRRSP